MSLFTDLVQHLTGSDPDSAQRQSRGLAEGLLDLLQHDKTGGIEWLRERFQQSNLGDAMASWIGTGQNRSVSPEQVTEALGREQVEALSKRAGLPPEQGAGILSRYLPEFIDKLTPEGRIPEKGQLSTLGKVILGGLGAAVAAGAAAKIFGKDKDEEQPAGTAESRGPTATAAPAGAAASHAAPVTEARPAAATTALYTVVSGDTLSKIAKRHYGRADQWPRIFEANRDILKDPDRIYPGQELRIP
jgi:uncharacterized protein YidB (DUF937 family)/LysM repeat protein